MNILLLGKPGSGKGTQSGLLIRDHDFVHVSTGDMLRQAKEQGSKLGLEAYRHWWDGGYVPDDIMIPLMEEQIVPIVRSERYLGDGYPRTIPQAESFDALLDTLGTKLHAVVLLDVADENCRERLLERTYCPACKINYNTTNPLFMESKKGICNCCRGDLMRRVDDSSDRIDYRLNDVYVRLVQPLYQYYRENNLLYKIDANADPHTVNANLISLLERLG
ncbi:MAG: nucleoside monophosphate kinase [bacterium]|jgi:adenylate kinase|nr:nucleoside monophosphate kinase [bacterium]